MTERIVLTSREAVLSSLLLHACLVIFFLLFPGVFSPGEPRVPPASSHTAIPVAFQMGPPPEERDASFLGDSGEGAQSDRRPPDAPPARNEDPYAQGNTPNRFLAPPSPEPPAPDAGPSAGPPPPPDPGDETGDGEDRARDEAGAGGEPSPRSDSGRGEPMPSAGSRQGEGAGEETPGTRSSGRRPSLRERLGQMALGAPGTGGAPLRYDNPVGGLSGPHGGLAFETSGYDWGPYARKIYWVIYNNWIRSLPPAAWAGFKGAVTVNFRIQRDGRVTDIQVVAPSGTPAYDRCATVALEASDPLPALPDDFKNESEGVTARFLYDVDSWDR